MKKDRTDLEAVRRDSLAYEDACQIRSREMEVEESSSIPVISERITNDGEEIDVGTTQGNKPDQPTCWEIVDAMLLMFDSPTTLSLYIFYSLGSFC